jgi:DnaJ-class molecular chaperone
MNENPYKILDLNKNASKAEIKKKYRALSLKYHPDRPEGDEEKFKEINKAYIILSDTVEKEKYDNKQPQGFNDMNFFNEMFGVNRFKGASTMPFRQRHMLNIDKSYEISFQESWSGVIKQIIIERFSLINGMKVIETEQLYIRIPPGLRNGNVIILKGKGNSIHNRIFGDVMVNIVVKNTTEFIRDELDLILKKKITFKESLVGFKFDIKHISGKKYCINNFDGKVIKDGYMKVVPRLGFFTESQGRKTEGNLLVVFSVDYPDKLEKEIRDKLAEVLP